MSAGPAGALPRLALLVAGLAALPAAVPAAEVELEGTWHVLVHYRDTESPRPERKHWEDRVWVFERRGERLRWTEYPIVVFDDQEGRFEALGGNRAQRVLGFWEPNEAQREAIRAGPAVNSRGSREKTLRGSAETGWSSREAGRGYRSARYLTYESTWSVEGLPDAPVFRQQDALGGAAAEDLEGQTVYTTVSVEEGGELLRGRYLRDARRVGSFQMRRAGAVRGVEKRERSNAERVRERFFGELGAQLLRGDLAEAGSEDALREAIESGEFDDADRERLRAAIRADLEEQYRSQGNDPREHQAAIDSLTRAIERLLVEEGKSVAEIRALLRRGELRP